MKKETLGYLTSNEGLGAGALGSGDVVGIGGTPWDVSRFWHEVANGEVSFAFEGIAFRHFLDKTEFWNNKDLKRLFFLWHGRIGKNTHYQRPVSDLVKVSLLDLLLADAETITDYIDSTGMPGASNLHEPAAATINGAGQKIHNSAHAGLLIENDFGAGSCQRARKIADTLGFQETVYDIGHGRFEFDDFTWEIDYPKLISQVYQMDPSVVHVLVGTAFDNVPDLPEDFYIQMAQAQRDLGFVLEFETQMGDIGTSILRSRRSLSHFVGYVQKKIKPWVTHGMVPTI